MPIKLLTLAFLVAGLLFSIRRMSTELDAFVYTGCAIATIVALLWMYDIRTLKFKIREKS